jgi:hypothetical protein
MQLNFNPIIVFILLLFILQEVNGQKSSEKNYDPYSDTLLILGEKVIDKEKIMITRETLLNSDTIRINQKGLFIEQFTFYAIALGQTFNLTTNKPLLSDEMRNEIRNNEPNYKIIYLKDIILRSKDGRKVKPSIQTLKITFSN